MRSGMLLVVLVMAIALLTAGCDGGRPAGLTGQPAPDFSVTMLDGSTARLIRSILPPSTMTAATAGTG